MKLVFEDTAAVLPHPAQGRQPGCGAGGDAVPRERCCSKAEGTSLPEPLGACTSEGIKSLQNSL